MMKRKSVMKPLTSLHSSKRTDDEYFIHHILIVSSLARTHTMHVAFVNVVMNVIHIWMFFPYSHATSYKLNGWSWPNYPFQIQIMQWTTQQNERIAFEALPLSASKFATVQAKSPIILGKWEIILPGASRVFFLRELSFLMNIAFNWME